MWKKFDTPAPAERIIKLVSPHVNQKRNHTKLAILGCHLKLDIAQYLTKQNKKKRPAKYLLMIMFCKIAVLHLWYFGKY